MKLTSQYIVYQCGFTSQTKKYNCCQYKKKIIKIIVVTCSILLHQQNDTMYSIRQTYSRRHAV